jgi:hypothetical protein
MSSHANDGTVESHWRRRYRVLLVTALPSPTGDGAAVFCDEDDESCRRQRRRGNLVVARCRCRVMLAVMLLSHAGNGTAEATWSRWDVDVKSCW